jgi:hypothetical protein
LEAGLSEVRLQKVISLIEIKLTTNPTPEDKKSPGYQPPITKTDPITP